MSSPLPIQRAISRIYSSLLQLTIRDLRPCFDAAYYLERYPDVESSGLDPLGHFLLFGAREGRQPHPLFDPRYYCASYPDVAVAGANPLLHFLRHGWKEGRRPNPLFDPAFYATQVPDLPRNRNPFVDFVERRRRGEKPRGVLPFTLPDGSYQVAINKIVPTADVVDVIVPIFAGFDETRRCLKSLFSSVCQTQYDLVLVDDRTPDPALARYVRDTAAAHGVTLLVNSENLGFAGSVNRGMELHPDRDVVLLNSDTEVANDWLDRLVAAAGSGSRTGTVTPFSNHATICSYPKPDVANRLPESLTTAELDLVFRQANAGRRVKIPTAVGFCMYIRRDCLKESGGFRPEVFGKGYGEENDFCVRATYKGWDHVLAADTFVYHAGAASFAEESEPRRLAAAERLRHLYPEYDRMIAGHTRNDPVKAYRVAVSGWRMRHSGKPVILAISHDLGGGVEQYLKELREVVGNEASMLLLTPTTYGGVTLRNLDQEDDFSVSLDIELDYAVLIDLLRSCGVTRIHIHHTFGYDIDLDRLRQDLGVPSDFSVHDYAVICPQVTLSDAMGRYCGEPDAAACNNCIAARPNRQRLDIALWRRKYAPLVRNADRVIAPSRDAADRMLRYFPEAKVIPAKHPARPEILGYANNRPTADGELIIAVLGVMNPHKGIERLRICAGEAKRKALPLRFVLAGYVDPPSASNGPEPFEQTGPYKKDELPDLLRKLGIHLVWFPAQWPETFSYTLSTCLESGVPVAAPDIGAFPERLAGRSWTWILPWDQPIDDILELFLRVRRENFLPGVAPPLPRDNRQRAVEDFYPLSYLIVTDRVTD